MSYLTPRYEQEGMRASLKTTVRVATTGNLNLGSTLTVVDTVPLADADRVLVRAQTTTYENGIYTWSSTTSMLSRARDALQLSDGLLVTVGEGGVFQDSIWKLTTNNPITLGVTGLAFVQQLSGGDLAATLTLGNTTSGSDIVLSSGDVLTTPTSIGMTIAAGSGSGSAGGSLSLLAGGGDGFGQSGGDLLVSSGDGGTGSGHAGDLSLTGGNATSGIGGDANTTGGNGTTAGGSSIHIGGNASTGTGGVAGVKAGNSGGANQGPQAYLIGGAGGTTGPGGPVLIQGGAAGGGVTAGGDIQLVVGAGAGGGADGAIQAQGTLKVTLSVHLAEQGAAPSTAANEGALYVDASNNLYYRNESDGSSVQLTGTGSIPSLATVLGAGQTTGGLDIIVTGGDVLTAPDDTALSLISGLGSTLTSPGSDLNLSASAGGATSGNGGDVVLTPGAAPGAGVVGEVRVAGDLNVTGKLSVGGLIDPPTGLIMAEASAPSTAVAEGALYIDTNNVLQYRGESDGTSIPLTGTIRTLTGASYASVDAITSVAGVGQFGFDPTEWGLTRNFYFDVVLSVNDGARTAQAWLYNLTDSEIVTGTTHSTSSTTPVKFRSSALTVGVAAGNLKSSAKVYEVRIDNDGTLITELSYLGSAMMVVEG